MLKFVFMNNTDIDMLKYEKLASSLIEKAIPILNLQNKNLEFTINWINSAKALELNKIYRQKKYIPDVLSFPVELNDEEVKVLGIRELGDIFICYEEAQTKSLKYKHLIEQEMAFLIVHGFLHLLGYDHEDNPIKEKEMFGLQDQILDACGLTYEIKFIADDYLELEN